MVVETNTVPKTHVAGSMLIADTPAAAEPIGQRIIEIPEDLERTNFAMTGQDSSRMSPKAA